MKHTLRIIVLDRPSVLARVAGQVGRRGVNIDHFTARNVDDGKTVITIGIDTDEHLAERLAKGIARLIDVLDVTWKRDETRPDGSAAEPAGEPAECAGEPAERTREGERCP
jgi:acetolactate synthase small subunit